MTAQPPTSAPLGDPFTLCCDEPVALAGTGLALTLRDVQRAYAGHAFEELGDEFEARLEIELDGQAKTVDLSWWEREDPPGQVLVHRGYAFEVLGSSTGHFRKHRCLRLRVRPRATSE